MIPIWLVVGGVSILVTIPVGLVGMKVEACRCLMVLPNIFNFCWFIVGNVYVFGNWSRYNDPYSLECDGLTYMFSFVLLIMAWVAVPILCILGCVCSTAVMGFLAMGVSNAPCFDP